MDEKANKAIQHRVETIKSLEAAFFNDFNHNYDCKIKNDWRDREGDLEEIFGENADPIYISHIDIQQKSEEDIIQSGTPYEKLLYVFNEWETGDKDPLPIIRDSLETMDKSDREVFEQGIHIYKTLLLFQNRFKKEYDEYEKYLRRLVYAIDFTEVCEAITGFVNKIYRPKDDSKNDHYVRIQIDEILRFRRDCFFYYDYRDSNFSYDRRPDIEYEVKPLNSKSPILKKYITGLLTFLSERLLLFYIPLPLAEKMLDLLTDSEIKELLGDQYFTNAKPKYKFPTEHDRLECCPDLKKGPNSPWKVKWNIIVPFKEIPTSYDNNQITRGLNDYFNIDPKCDIMYIAYECWANQHIPIDLGD